MPYALPTVDQSAAELKRQLALERRGERFLVLREPRGGEQLLVSLAGRERITIGRGPGVDVSLDGDDSVSRLHAELELVGDHWVVADDGLSRNGTLVNDEPLATRRRLGDRDLIKVGGTGLLFRDPLATAGPPVTRARSATGAPPEVAGMQRRVAVALCRPLAAGHVFAAAPASNRAIAAELVISVSAVKAHLRSLFEKFGLRELPQNRKRVALAEALLRSGAIHPRELSPAGAGELPEAGDR